MIRFQALSITYEKTVIKEVTLHVPPAGHIAFMGPSGSGKTSLLHAVAGLHTPSGGSVHVSSSRIAYVFQEPRLLPWLTTLENTALVLTGPDATDQALAWLNAVGLLDAANKYPHELSGGMQQRANLARALAYNGDILLLDEPTASLDTALREDILSLIHDHTRDKTLLLATHSESEANSLAEHIYCIEDGVLITK